jgi:hypothetical protein
MKKVAQRWDSLDEAGRNRYTASYKKEMEEYSTILENYRQSLTPAMEATTEQLRMEKQMKKDKRERRRRLKACLIFKLFVFEQNFNIVYFFNTGNGKAEETSNSFSFISSI